MRKLIDEMSAEPTIQRRLDLANAGERYLAHLAGVMERKATTVQDYRIMLTRHFGWKATTQRARARRIWV